MEQAVAVETQGGDDGPAFELEGPIDPDHGKEETGDHLADTDSNVDEGVQVHGGHYHHGQDHEIEQDPIDRYDGSTKVAATAKKVRVVPSGVGSDLVVDFESVSNLVSELVSGVIREAILSDFVAGHGDYLVGEGGERTKEVLMREE